MRNFMPPASVWLSQDVSSLSWEFDPHFCNK